MVITERISANGFDVSEVGRVYRQHGPFALNEGRELVERLISPRSVLKMQTVTDLGFPAVAGIAPEIHEFVSNSSTLQWSDYTKRFIGAIVCMVMQANGYHKTGQKKIVPHGSFRKAEVYEKN